MMKNNITESVQSFLAQVEEADAMLCKHIARTYDALCVADIVSSQQIDSQVDLLCKLTFEKECKILQEISQSEVC